MDQSAREGARYRAFISYSHRDAAFGRRLHRRLEAYRVPRRLVGRSSPCGPVPARLAPIFRDREELAAADDLTAEIRAALDASWSLIVVCSPAAAASPWVAREVEVFRTLHPDRPVLAAIVEGDPADCFPEAIRRAAEGQDLVEPLAADFRAGRDGVQLGLLKLVAGVLGVKLDELVQRDAQRRLRTVTAVTAGAVTATLAMGLLTVFALDARAQAERQRAQAEGLVEFMLTDLRQRLEGVGRLDVLAAVNRRALAYYAGEDLDRLPADSLERRARLLHAMGEDDEARGDLDRAQAQFREASRTTGSLLADAPDDPERIFDHAQSVFWVGSVDYRRGRLGDARTAFLSYKTLADRLVTLKPNEPKYVREAGYAEGNLCSLALEPPRQLAEALRSCKAALTHMRRAADMSPTTDARIDLVNRQAWLADAYFYGGDYEHARQERLQEAALLAPLMADDPQNMQLKSTWVALQRGLAMIEKSTGDEPAARRRLQDAYATVTAMIAYEPDDAEWKRQRDRIRNDLTGR